MVIREDECSSRSQPNLLTGLSSNLVGKLILGSPGLITFRPHSTDFLPFHSLWLIEVSMHMQTNRWSDLAQIWRANSLWSSLTYLNCCHAPLNSDRFLASECSSSFCAFGEKNAEIISLNCCSKVHPMPSKLLFYYKWCLAFAIKSWHMGKCWIWHTYIAGMWPVPEALGYIRWSFMLRFIS